MFNQLVVSGAHQEGTHKPWTVAMSALVQAVIVGVMILIPLIYTEALPKGMLNTFLVAPAPPPPPPPPAAPVKIVRPRIVQPQTMVAPTVIPKKVEMIKDEAPDVGAGARRIWRRRRYRRRSRWRHSKLGSAASAEGRSHPHQSRRTGPGREYSSPGIAGLSGNRQDGSRLRHRASARNHCQGRLDSGTAVRLRSCVADEGGHGRRARMALPAHDAQWRARGSGYHD